MPWLLYQSVAFARSSQFGSQEDRAKSSGEGSCLPAACLQNFQPFRIGRHVANLEIVLCETLKLLAMSRMGSPASRRLSASFI